MKGPGTRPKLDESLYRKLAQVLEDRFGLHFPVHRWQDLDRSLASAAEELGFDSLEACAKWLADARLTKNEIEILAAHLTIGETYFFRDKGLFHTLEQRLFPELIAKRRTTGRRLRIWSAGCCTGEEPYSIAILLTRLLPDIAQWDITILGTDINPRFLQKALKGEYRAWSFRGVPETLRRSCFDAMDDQHFQIHQRYRKMVTFASLNLVKDAYPSPLNNTNAMDAILCRNVLMYLTPAQSAKVGDSFFHSLLGGGWLVLSPSEMAHGLFPQFERVHFAESIVLRKRSIDQERAPAAAAPAQQKRGTAAGDTGRPPPTEPIARSHPLEEAGRLFDNGNYAEAARLLRPLARQAPGNSQTALLLARCCANGANLDEALSWCEKAIEADKVNPAGHFLRAAILQERAATGEAVAALKRALFLDSRFVMAHFVVATLLRKEGNQKEAVRHFQNAAELAAQLPPDQVLPESEGLTAGRLSELISSMHPAIPSA